VRGPSIVKDDYSKAMIKLELWQKDMKIIGEFARDLDCPTPLFATTAPLYNAAIATGHGEHDTAAVGAVLGAMAGLGRRVSAPAGRARRARVARGRRTR
jgi:3-hydroxyisobutyrate dehydrogenase-like beta-hydroxyacid dehydrogenase